MDILHSCRYLYYLRLGMFLDFFSKVLNLNFKFFNNRAPWSSGSKTPLLIRSSNELVFKTDKILQLKTSKAYNNPAKANLTSKQEFIRKEYFGDLKV